MISQKSQNMIQTGPGSNLGVLQVPDTLASVLLSAGPTAAKLPTQRRNVTLRPQGIHGEQLEIVLFPATRLQHLVEMQISWGCLRFEIRLGIPERGEAGLRFLRVEPSPSSRPCRSGTCRFSSATYACATYACRATWSTQRIPIRPGVQTQ